MKKEFKVGQRLTHNVWGKGVIITVTERYVDDLSDYYANKEFKKKRCDLIQVKFDDQKIGVKLFNEDSLREKLED